MNCSNSTISPSADTAATAYALSRQARWTHPLAITPSRVGDPRPEQQHDSHHGTRTRRAHYAAHSKLNAAFNTDSKLNSAVKPSSPSSATTRTSRLSVLEVGLPPAQPTSSWLNSHSNSHSNSQSRVALSRSSTVSDSISEESSGLLPTSSNVQLDLDTPIESLSSKSGTPSLSSSEIATSDCFCNRLREESTCPRQNPPKPVKTYCRKYKTGAMGASLLRALLLYMCLAFLFWPGQANLSITAFEYQRKFNNALDLGECTQREVTYPGNNSTHVLTLGCGALAPRTGTKRHLARKLYDPRNVLITSPEQITNYFTLCGGEAAAFLGILNNHEDCLAVEIASRLTFNEKTVIRLFVGYYRKSVDKLDVSDKDKTKERYHYIRDKMYLEARSIGTTEIVFAQFRFKTAKLAREASKIDDLDSPNMSDYMQAIAKKVGTPKHTTILYMSTSQRLIPANAKDPYTLKKFPNKDWLRAVRMAETSEIEIHSTIDRINKGFISPHLTYTLRPWDPTADYGTFRSFRKEWENVSILEVQLRQTFNHVKKTAKRCRKNRRTPCNRVRELKRKLSRARQDIHTGRSNWHTMESQKKTEFVRNFTKQVTDLNKLSKVVVKQARKFLKTVKLERFLEDEKKDNMIPTLASDTSDEGKLARVRTKPNRANRANRLNRKSKSRRNRKSKKGRKSRQDIKGRKSSRTTNVTKSPRFNKSKHGRISKNPAVHVPRVLRKQPIPSIHQRAPTRNSYVQNPRLKRPMLTPSYKPRPQPRGQIHDRTIANRPNRLTDAHRLNRPSVQPRRIRHFPRKLVIRTSPYPRHTRRKSVQGRNG